MPHWIIVLTLRNLLCKEKETVNPAVVRGDEGLAAMRELVMTYIRCERHRPALQNKIIPFYGDAAQWNALPIPPGKHFPQNVMKKVFSSYDRLS